MFAGHGHHTYACELPAIEVAEKLTLFFLGTCILQGKKYSGHQMLRHVYWQCGVIPSDISGLEKFEGVDPAKFCDWGYAVASVDSRGAGHSEG